MSDPDVVLAIDDLVSRGVLDPRGAAPLRRVASGRLISVREELRVLLWAGVALLAAGAGLLVKVNLDRIGPVVVAVALGLAAAGCLAWVARRAPGFTWSEGPAGDFAADYVLLLGALLAAADLAFVEVRFTPLGPRWPWHLLLVAAGYGALAFRFDSKALFSLALTSFAAWRGVALSRLESPWELAREDRPFVEAMTCGLLFLALGQLLVRAWRKPHFEPVAAWLGWILIVGALFVRVVESDASTPYAFALGACGVVLAWFAWDERRLGRFALGVGAVGTGIAGVTSEAFEAMHLRETAFELMVLVLASGVLAVVYRAHAAMKARS